MNPDRPYDPIPFAVIDSITVADLDRLFHVAGATHGRGHTSNARALFLLLDAIRVSASIPTDRLSWYGYAQGK